LRAQIFVARDSHRECFGRDPRGIWLPECAYSSGLDEFLAQANIRWFVTETHGLLHATPRPRFATFSPIFTPQGVAVFGRDPDSAQQVWSRAGGYPGDPAYRDFYRDIAFDLDLEYLEPYLSAPGCRTFTGLKYYRVTGPAPEKAIYDREAAMTKVAEHARHFLQARTRHLGEAAKLMDQPPILLAPYDAELFGHWWYEGPEFLREIFLAAAQSAESPLLVTPGEFLREHPRHQIAEPAPSSWGEDGYMQVWMHENNQWIFPHLEKAQERMAELARLHPGAEGLLRRALNQAARELMLAQSSDWPFMLRNGGNAAYATRRVTGHLQEFTRLHERIAANSIDESELAGLESRDNLFPEINYRYWA
jgi:1,4-alpha-glucan branching enzyme